MFQEILIPQVDNSCSSNENTLQVYYLGKTSLNRFPSRNFQNFEHVTVYSESLGDV